jgi:hypothetical protein
MQSKSHGGGRTTKLCVLMFDKYCLIGKEKLIDAYNINSIPNRMPNIRMNFHSFDMLIDTVYREWKGYIVMFAVGTSWIFPDSLSVLKMDVAM